MSPSQSTRAFNPGAFDPIDYPGREFYVHAYHQGHLLLYLRGPRHQGRTGTVLPKRVDLMFTGVEFVQLQTALTGLHVTLAVAERIAVVQRELQRAIPSYASVFEVASEEYHGLVLASAVFVAEDDEMSSSAPSLLGYGLDARRA